MVHGAPHGVPRESVGEEDWEGETPRADVQALETLSKEKQGCATGLAEGHGVPRDPDGQQLTTVPMA